MSGIERPQPGESVFQRTSHSPKRSRLLFGELIGENVDGNTIKAKITGHPVSPGSLRNRGPSSGVTSRLSIHVQASRARISGFSTLPTLERGRSSQTSICFGVLTLPICCLTKIASSAASMA